MLGLEVMTRISPYCSGIIFPGTATIYTSFFFWPIIVLRITPPPTPPPPSSAVLSACLASMTTSQNQQPGSVYVRVSFIIFYTSYFFFLSLLLELFNNTFFCPVIIGHAEDALHLSYLMEYILIKSTNSNKFIQSSPIKFSLNSFFFSVNKKKNKTRHDSNDSVQCY